MEIIIFFSWRDNALVGLGLLIHEVCFSRSHMTHHSRYDSSGRVISLSQRPLPDNTQHSQQTDIHAPGGIQTHDLSRQVTVDLRLRPRGHWDWHMEIITLYIHNVLSIYFIIFYLLRLMHFSPVSCYFLFGLSACLGTLILIYVMFSSVNVRDQVSHAHKVRSKIIILYILIFIFFDSQWGDKRFWNDWLLNTKVNLNYI